MDSREALWSVLLCLSFVNGLYSDDSHEGHFVASINFTICNNKCVSLMREGKYGQLSLRSTAKGYLVHSDSIYGCAKSSFQIKKQPWIALISRGKCMFTEKIKNAVRQNVSGIIIYNNKPDGDDYTMTHENANVVAVSVDDKIGREMYSKLNSSSVYVEITFNRHETRRKLNQISVLFVSVTFIVLMVISLAWLVYYYVQRFRYLYARDKSERRLTTAAKKAIAKLHSRTVSKKEDEDISESNCAVCLEEYSPGETLRTLPCKHEFHKHCVDPWLIEHRTCPMCKNNILKELGIVVQEDDALSTHEQQEMNLSVSVDNDNGLHNGGLTDDDSSIDQDDDLNSQGSTSHLVCEVTPVETTSNNEPTFVKVGKLSKRNSSV